MLLNALKRQTADTNYQRILDEMEVYSITGPYNRFKVALLAELSTFPSYFVTRKGAFDTTALLESGESLFPSDLLLKVPEALFDTREAGKALAFELPTACGFHVFRATESVIRRYYTEVTGGQPLPKVRNIGVYIKAIRKAQCGDEKILSTLEQMASLHRNPLIHPEAVLTMDEAILSMGIACSAITAMLAALPKQQPTTASPLTP